MGQPESTVKVSLRLKSLFQSDCADQGFLQTDFTQPVKCDYCHSKHSSCPVFSGCDHWQYCSRYEGQIIFLWKLEWFLSFSFSPLLWNIQKMYYPMVNQYSCLYSCFWLGFFLLFMLQFLCDQFRFFIPSILSGCDCWFSTLVEKTFYIINISSTLPAERSPSPFVWVCT